MEFVIFSAQGPVKSVNQPSCGKMSQSVHQRLKTVTSEQQTAEKSPGETEVFQSDTLYENNFLEVSPYLKEENSTVDIKQVQVCGWVVKEK